MSTRFWLREGAVLPTGIKADVEEENGRKYVWSIGGLFATQKPTKEIMELVDRITILETMVIGVHQRTRGVYHHRTASCQVEDSKGQNARPMINLAISSETLEDAKEIAELIASGRIYPTVSYEEKQVPPPFRHVRQLLEELWEVILRDANQTIRRLRTRTRTA